MKKIYTILVFVAVLILSYACCKDTLYKSEISGIKFDKYNEVAISTYDSTKRIRLKVDFYIVNKFTQISSLGLITEAKADGTICNSHTNYEKYYDPISEINLFCDKDFLGVQPNVNLAKLIKARVISTNIKTTKFCDQYVVDFNNEVDLGFAPMANEPGNILFELDISKSDFPQSGDYKFKLQIKTQSGKVFEAESANIVIN